MESLMERPALVRRLEQASRLLNLRGPILLAVSGGADSLAMLLGFHELSHLRGNRLQLVVATIDHGLRPGSDDDARYVAQVCRRLHLPCEVRAVAVPSEGSLEAAARDARYAALEQIAQERGCGFIATAHTLEDQAETVLLRLGRGAGVRGLRGILPQRGIVVRPMLEISRAEVAAYLAARRAVPRRDPTNASLRFDRNRVRALVLPAVELALGEAAVRSIARTAAAARDDEEFLEEAAGKASKGVWAQLDGQVTGSVAALDRLPRALQRRVLRQAAASAGAELELGHLESVEAALGKGRPARAQLPRGLEFQVAYGRFGIAPLSEPSRGFRYRLDGPGRHNCGRFVVSVQECPGPGLEGTDSLRIDPARVALPLWFRSRLPGDRFRPLGGRGKRLKEFLIDQKVPQADRGALPLLCDDEGRILWVVGMRPSDAAAEGRRAKKAWEVRIEVSG